MKKLLLPLLLALAATATSSAQTIKATLVDATGKVLISNDGSSHPSKPGETLPVGTSIVTGPASKAVIQAFPGVGIRLNENSGVSVSNLSYKTVGPVQQRSADFVITKGTFVFAMDPGSEKDNDNFQVHVGNTVIKAHGANGVVTMNDNGPSVLSSGGDLSIITPHEGAVPLNPDWQYAVGRGTSEGSPSSISEAHQGVYDLAAYVTPWQFSPGAGPGSTSTPPPSYGHGPDGFAGGYDPYGYDKFGHDRFGYDRSGHDRFGFDHHGFDRFGYDRFGHDRFGYDRHGFDKFGHDKFHNDRFAWEKFHSRCNLANARPCWDGFDGCTKSVNW